MSTYQELLDDATTAFNEYIAGRQASHEHISESGIDRFIGETADSEVPASIGQLMQLFVDNEALGCTAVEGDGGDTVAGWARQAVYESVEQHLCGLKEDLLQDQTCEYCGNEISGILAIQRPAVDDVKAWRDQWTEHHSYCPWLVTHGTMMHHYAEETAISAAVIALFAEHANLQAVNADTMTPEAREILGVRYDLEYVFADDPRVPALAFSAIDETESFADPNVYALEYLDAMLDSHWMDFMSIPRQHGA